MRDRRLTPRRHRTARARDPSRAVHQRRPGRRYVISPRHPRTGRGARCICKTRMCCGRLRLPRAPRRARRRKRVTYHRTHESPRERLSHRRQRRPHPVRCKRSSHDDSVRAAPDGDGDDARHPLRSRGLVYGTVRAPRRQSGCVPRKRARSAPSFGHGPRDRCSAGPRAVPGPGVRHACFFVERRNSDGSLRVSSARLQPSLERPAAIDVAVLHDESDVAQGVNVGCRIAVDGDQIGE